MKIYSTSYLEPNEVSECVIEEGIRQSRSFPPLDQVQKRWESAVASAIEPIASFDPSIRDSVTPDELSATQAIKHSPGHLGVDIRPHLFDSQLKKHLLCDSGSQITAWPPDEGDLPMSGTYLRAVNGAKLNCYGYKQVTIKIGRKSYHYQAIKADVQSPIIGWDFFRHYRIGFRWTKWGDIELFDKKANISQIERFIEGRLREKGKARN